MKVAVIEKPGVLAVKNAPEPVVGDYDCLCELLYGATCSGTDLHMLEGRLPFPIPYPTVFGHESVGRVVQTGFRVRNFKVGDLISRAGAPASDKYGSSWGGFAERGIARDHFAMKEDGLPASEWAKDTVNQILPADMDLRAATMVITWRETYSYSCRLGVKDADIVVVIGSGGNGLAYCSHAASLGAKTVVMIGSKARFEAGRSAGATHCLDYTSDGLSGQLKTILRSKIDVIIDSVGKNGQIDRILPQLKPDGSIGVYGLDDCDVFTVSPRLASGSFTFSSPGYDEAEAHEDVMRLIDQEKLDATIWLDFDSPFDLDDIADAMQAVQDRKVVKAVVKLS